MNKTEEVKKRHLPRWVSSSKSRAVFVLVVLVILVGSASAYLYVRNNGQNNSITTYYQEGKGGDPAAVIKYHKEAVKAWKAGDEGKAKKLAKKGIEQANKLTIAQQSKIPNEMSVVYELNDLVDGIYYGK
ncbi:MAG: hypothetical protein AAB462_00285 [Patescibacteria group bacterium]